VIRLILVDDDPMVRTGLRLILGGEQGIDVVGEAGDGVEAERLVRELRPDLVLLDIRMPVQDGLVTVEHLCAAPAPPAVIMLTTFDTDELVLRALKAGATGFFVKDTRPAKLIEGIRNVVAGEPMMSPGVTRQVIAAATSGGRLEQTKARSAIASLTDREREIALQIAFGHSNADIASILFISTATVKATVTRIFQKLGTDNRVQVALTMRDARDVR
jgi:DNA-binding NarL/FixJ family response regulator